MAHIEGVRSVPLQELGNHLAEFQDKQKIYVHCNSGNRSRLAIRLMEAHGIAAELINVEGGIVAWARSGKPINRA